MSIRLRAKPQFLSLVAVILALTCAGITWADANLLPLPKPARVIDQTHTLSTDEIKALDTRLNTMEQRRGAQLAIVMVPTTHPETIEQYATRTHEAWRPSRRGAENYLLVFVAKDDRQARIEVGFDLELAVSDKTTTRLVHETLLPAFKEGRFFDGLNRTTSLLDGLMDGKPLEPPAKLALNKETLLAAAPWAGLVLVLLLVLNFLRGRSSSSTETLTPPQSLASPLPSTEIRRGWRPWS